MMDLNERCYRTTAEDPELASIEVICVVLNQLEPEQQARVIQYAAERYKP